MTRQLLVLLLTTTTAAAAEPTVVTYPPGDDRIVVLHKGDPAPYTGQLFDDPTALRWAVWLQQYKSRYSLDLSAQQATCDARLGAADSLAKVELTRTTKVEETLRQSLRESEASRVKLENELRDPGFFKQPGFWYGVGVLSTVAVVAVTAYAIKSGD